MTATQIQSNTKQRLSAILMKRFIIKKKKQTQNNKAWSTLNFLLCACTRNSFKWWRNLTSMLLSAESEIVILRQRCIPKIAFLWILGIKIRHDVNILNVRIAWRQNCEKPLDVLSFFFCLKPKNVLNLFSILLLKGSKWFV